MLLVSATFLLYALSGTLSEHIIHVSAFLHVKMRRKINNSDRTQLFGNSFFFFLHEPFYYRHFQLMSMKERLQRHFWHTFMTNINDEFNILKSLHKKCQYYYVRINSLNRTSICINIFNILGLHLECLIECGWYITFSYRCGSSTRIEREEL